MRNTIIRCEMIENLMQTHYKFHANTQDTNVITVHKTQILQHCTRHRFYQNTQNTKVLHSKVAAMTLIFNKQG